jgi:predicted GIY-YIG superfamily endonuclease
MSGVYFLYLNDQLQYIGKSINVDKRISQHDRIGLIKFNKTNVIEVKPQLLIEKEKEFIKSMKPRFNTWHNPEKKESTERIISNCFFVSYIAQEYYKIKHPERRYTRHYSIRQWRQDKTIDKDIVNVVLKKIFEEQTKLLKHK